MWIVAHVTVGRTLPRSKPWALKWAPILFSNAHIPTIYHIPTRASNPTEARRKRDKGPNYWLADKEFKLSCRNLETILFDICIHIYIYLYSGNLN